MEMVLNLLQRHDLAKARELVERSFGRYLASLDLLEEEILQQLRLQLGQLRWDHPVMCPGKIFDI